MAYFDHVICWYNTSFTSNCTCKLNFITRMDKSFTSYCNITKKMDDVLGYSQLYHRFRSGYKLFLIDTNINLCDYMKNKTTSKIIDLVLPKLLPYWSGDVGQKLDCPFFGRMYIVNMPLNGAIFNNMFIPVGDYMLNLTATTSKGELIWNGRFYFTIPEGKTIEDDRMGR